MISESMLLKRTWVYEHAFDAPKCIIWKMSYMIKCLLLRKEGQGCIFMSMGCVMIFFNSILILCFGNCMDNYQIMTCNTIWKK